MTFYDDRHHYRHFSIDILRDIQALSVSQHLTQTYEQACRCASSLSELISTFDRSSYQSRNLFLDRVHYPHLRDIERLEQTVEKNVQNERILQCIYSLKFNLQGLADEIADATLTVQEIFLPDLVEVVATRHQSVFPFLFQSTWESTFPTVRASVQHINVIFDNLFSNSIKYKAPRPLIIAVRGWTNSEGCHIGFGDNGLGIPSDKLRLLGHPGKRFHPQIAQGEGLGLATVKRIMGKHDGIIKARSAEGRGTEIILSFPVNNYHG